MKRNRKTSIGLTIWSMVSWPPGQRTLGQGSRDHQVKGHWVKDSGSDLLWPLDTVKDQEVKGHWVKDQEVKGHWVKDQEVKGHWVKSHTHQVRVKGHILHLPYVGGHPYLYLSYSMASSSHPQSLGFLERNEMLRGKVTNASSK